MKKIWYSIIAGTALLECHTAQAVAIGDTYYSDKTFSAELVASKTPIGLVYWVSPGGDFGLIMQLEQPANTMNYYGANLYCNEYKTEGTKAGDWWLP